ncbi:helix-turn-helix domain-containing protein [Sphingobacterium athyrii]|uniref:DNA-binding protein n=1 Tax=Sphingobacterium athyrii TaxID=2152717 RepID=A0A363NUG8_9SPHI|nr:helix-turn-helix domain-containing protein [Sphingobacterium athyrii]PUV24462.1 DNA-binding protein [Sphingobacterium athyrii]
MEILSKQDLEIFRIKIISDIERLLETNNNHTTEEFDWLRSKAVRKMMDISPATLQNLRITGKIRHKKVLGSYYYNKTDLQKLFEDEN